MITKMAVWIYRMLTSVGALGIRGSLILFISAFWNHSFYIRPKGYPNALLLRGKTSDCDVFYAIICRQVYHPPPTMQADTIIDAGANAGYATIYFAHQFPQARIIAIEPEASNFAVLLRNTADYHNITPLNAALSSNSQPLYLEEPTAEKWAFKYTMSPTEGVVADTCTMQEITERFKIEGIDLLKMDIEGAEAVVFSENTEWFSVVKHLFIEIHKGAWKPVFAALAPYNYDVAVRRGYLWIRLEAQ